jgi:hypothetical protein
VSHQACDLSAQVFCAIASRFIARAVDIGLFAETQFSFEEWCNWEAFLACRSRPEWSVVPKPSYCSLAVASCKDFGDLLVTYEGARSFVEIGLVHEGTGDKWIDKLNNDAWKLARVQNAGLLQIIVLVSDKTRIEASDRWQRWLSRITCWSRPTALVQGAPLLPNGSIFIKGWGSSGSF